MCSLCTVFFLDFSFIKTVVAFFHLILSHVVCVCFFRYVFDYHPGEVYWCTADIGWITGHSYITYGPMANGATSVLVLIMFVCL